MFSCEWPLSQFDHVMNPNYEAITQTCHTFRNYHDIDDSWKSVGGIIDFYGQHNQELMKYNGIKIDYQAQKFYSSFRVGPGHFFDPDMLAVGGFGLSHEQSKTQMTMWSMWSSPLMMSNDLRKIRADDKEILQNKAVIAINQDKHGKMARQVYAVS